MAAASTRIVATRSAVRRVAERTLSSAGHRCDVDSALTSTLLANGVFFIAVDAATNALCAAAALPRMFSHTNAFLFWGIIELVLTRSSGQSTRPYAKLDHV